MSKGTTIHGALHSEIMKQSTIFLFGAVWTAIIIVFVALDSMERYNRSHDLIGAAHHSIMLVLIGLSVALLFVGWMKKRKDTQ